MTSWQWILPQTVLAIHDAQIADHGGAPGLRDLGLLESALARPKNLLAHADSSPAPQLPDAPDAFDLAAAYAYGLARNHAFLDGNKRTAYVVARLFLLLHGHDLRGPDTERVLVFERLGQGELTQEELAGWMRG
ncbi:MAG: type II toxin-antitoxin system death-on-curing family toxin [Humidesulfovibrio sp.]|nr:type II toxin-antitoxin system death-on-curing family toxin [Humidesulfovibrio sp.]